MTWDDFERLLCLAVLRASAVQQLATIGRLWSLELEREYLSRWPVDGLRATLPTSNPPRVAGATANTASPSFADLPADHPFKRGGKWLGPA